MKQGENLETTQFFKGGQKMEGMFFTDETINKILNKLSIQNVIIEETVNCDIDCEIKKHHGFLYVNQCPFCHSNSPAMHINKTAGTYYCSSCGRGGNVIDFVMRIRNLSFTDAVSYLANKIKLQDVPVYKDKKVYSKKVTKIYNINQDAALFYFKQLRNKTGDSGMKYFENRGVSGKISSEFGLGYAGGFGDKLYQHLKSNGYTDTEILESGLIAKNTKPGGSLYYDKFWNRVIFPILNTNNRIIGFGGRLLGDGKPKYLNSPETVAFDKGKNLYCYNIAKKSKRPYYICCEGYMDAMSLHQFGYDCAVASLGTALTRDQIQLLSTKKEILLAYDSDEAGIRAAKRAIELCREVGLKIRVIRMDGAKDPDEYLKKFGTKAFDNLIKNAESDKHFLVRNSKKEDGKFDFDKAVEELF